MSERNPGSEPARCGIRFRTDPGTLVVLGYILIFEDIFRLLSIFSAILVHELGHLLMAHILKIRIRQFRLGMMGACIVTEGLFSYKNEALLCLAGPLFNIASAAVLYAPRAFFGGTYPILSVEFCKISLALAIFNLLPIRGFDGGRILCSIASTLFGELVSEYIITASSCLLIALLWVVSIYALIRFGGALSLFVFSILLFVNVFTDWRTQS